MTSASNYVRKYHNDGTEESELEEQKEMENLLESLPVLNEYFQLHNKIGQGTFSTVYLATLKVRSSTQKFAVKHLTQACEQSRIENELRCLQEIGGRDNVVHAELCLINGSCVTFIMPYLAHKRFSDYVVDMDQEETRFYMKNLFIALKRVHSFNIIHRDVKPNNFLYNRETKQFLLVDFGLAQLVKGNSSIKASTSVDENKPVDYSKKRKRVSDSSEEETKNIFESNKRIALKSKDNNARISSLKADEARSLGEAAETSQKTKSLLHSSCTRRKLLESRDHSKHTRASENTTKLLQSNNSTSLVSAESTSRNLTHVRNSKTMRQQPFSPPVAPASFLGTSREFTSRVQSCPCAGKGAVCSLCTSRQPMFAPRAGTSGFRPPEVLFKYLHQTTAVDMWAAGVVMLCILSGCYPFFNSASDLASLAEIMTIFGTERTVSVAKKFGRRILCSEHRKEIDLKKLCKRLRARSGRKSRSEDVRESEPRCRDCFQAVRKDGCLCRSVGEEAMQDCEETSLFPDSAYDLLYRLLDLDPTTRITAAEALDHPFIVGRS